MQNDKSISIRYIVNNVDEAVTFYSDCLGFEVDMRPAPGFAALSRDNLKLLLNQPGAGGAGQKMPDGKTPEPGGWNRIQVPVDDLETLQQELKKNGAHFKNEIIKGQGGKQVLLEDPSGNLIELFEPKENKQIKPVPKGFHTVTPFFFANEAHKLIEFIENAFKGKVAYMMKSDDGIVTHATVMIGDSLVMIANATARFKPMPLVLHLYVEDVDSVYKQAIGAGAISLREPENEFYGDRSAGVKDSWENQWWIATHIEDVSDEELKKRGQEFRKQKGLK